MGTLFLPSLKEKKFFSVLGVNLAEATEFMQEFTAKVKNGHKTKDNGSGFEPIVFHNMLDLDSIDDYLDLDDQHDLADVLKIADTPGTRGARVVFVEEDGTFAIGTTVVYNANWATLGFDDQTVLDKLRKAHYDLTIDVAPTPVVVPDDQHSWYASSC